jgi:hypothetical protein
MNALLFVVIGVILILIIAFAIALAQSSARACLAVFILMVLLVIGLTCTTFIRPNVSTWYIGNVKGNTMQIVNQQTREYLVLDLKNIPHINYKYEVDQEVQLTRTVLGDPIFVSPKLWTGSPKNY